MSIQAPVSVGELIDKLTILDIKAERITDSGKLVNIAREREALEAAWANSDFAHHDVSALRAALKQVNESLWVIEDDIRDKERMGNFDEEFIELARSVYITNDKRADLKRQLNVQVGSELVEEKSYQEYQAG